VAETETTEFLETHHKAANI